MHADRQSTEAPCQLGNSDAWLNKFNLTFSGEILSGHKPEDVRRRFGKAFHIDDPERLERFFSGETIILRRNLERKAAAQCYQEMREIGVVAELVKVSSEQVALEEAARKRREHDARRKAEEKAAKERERAAAAEVVRLEAERAAERERIIARREKEKAAREREQAELERKKAEQERLRAAREAAIAAEHERQRVEREREKARREAEKKAERERAEAERERQKAERAAARAEEARRKAEQLAREKARAAEAKRKAEEEHAQQVAEAAARARANAQREAARQAEIARQKALEDEQRAAHEAQQRAEQAARRAAAEKLRAEKAAERDAERERKREAEQRLQQEEKRRKKERAEETARQRILQELQQRREEQEQDNQRQQLEEQTISRGAAELARGAAVKGAHAKVKTRLEVPHRDATERSSTANPPPRRRQAGEPNFYTLKAFRVNEEIRQRPARALRGRRHGLGLLALAFVALAALLTLRAQWQPPSPLAGVESIAVNSAGELYLLAGNKLLRHDRAGIGEEIIEADALGLGALQPPLLFAPDDSLLLVAAAVPDTELSVGGAEQLQRCDLEQRLCTAISGLPPNMQVDAFLPHPLDGSLFVADAGAQALIQVDERGNMLGRAQLSLPQRPSMFLHSGLLFVGSATGPAISVYRYDRAAFGQQLDEMLLLPPPAIQAQHSSVEDFLLTGNIWWVILCNAEHGGCGLYRFDAQWNYLDTVPLGEAQQPLQLIAWGDRILVNSGRALTTERYNIEGTPGTPLQSDLVNTLAQQGERQSRLRHVALSGGLALVILLALCGCGLAYINDLRLLVYKPKRDRGAQPVDDYADSLTWVPPSPHRDRALKQRVVTAAVLALAVLLLCVGLGATSAHLGALLLALSGPFMALLILLRLPMGHIGTTGEHLLLVDHTDLYHFGGGSEIQYRGSFLILYDVVVFCGNRFAPAFARPQLNAQVTPLARNGVKIDRKTLLVKLVQARHPVIQALAAVVISSGVALAIIALPLVFH